MPTFKTSAVVDAPLAVVFAFHEKPEMFETLLPPRRKVEILRREGGIGDGGELEFRVRLGPFWFRWLARHTAYEKDRCFVDEQIKGPFRRWVHRHEFQAENGKTLLTDTVEYNLPGGAVMDFLGAWAVRLSLARMFDFRYRVIRRIAERTAAGITRTAAPRTPPDPPRHSQTS